MSNRWLLDGAILPRNPDSFEMPLKKANVYDETMLDGSLRRVALPVKLPGRDVKIGWKTADFQVRSAIAGALASSTSHVLQFTGTQPLVSLTFYVDDSPTDQVSDQIYDSRSGQGGIRRNIVIEGRGEAMLRSVNPVPGGQINLCTNSSTLTGWGLTGGFVAGTGGPGGAADAEYTGTGSAIGSYPNLALFLDVTMGKTYTPSFWVDPSQITNNDGAKVHIYLYSQDNLNSAGYDHYFPASMNTAQQFIGSSWTCPTNLIPHSDDFSTWAGGGGAIAAGGPNGVTDFEVTGTGSPQEAYLDSPLITVVPGTTYNISSWIDPSQISSGQCMIGLFNPARTQLYLAKTVGNGASGRFASSSWTCPAGVTQVQFTFDSNTCTITSGQKLKFTFPMLEPVSVSSGYYVSSQNPQVQVACGTVSSAIVANGQKFKVSQPMFQEGTQGTTYFPGAPFQTGVSFALANITSWFGGPLGVPQFDNLPTWNGALWNQSFSSGSGNATISNLGNANWQPTIRINGPFNTDFALNVRYTDVDGTGQGVTFTWTGNALATGSYLLFDTARCRVWTVINGVQTEVYTWTITTPGSSNAPFDHWPQIPPGNFTIYVTVAGQGSTTTVDYSNNGTEQFRYL